MMEAGVGIEIEVVGKGCGRYASRRSGCRM